MNKADNCLCVVATETSLLSLHCIKTTLRFHLIMSKIVENSVLYLLLIKKSLILLTQWCYVVSAAGLDISLMLL